MHYPPFSRGELKQQRISIPFFLEPSHSTLIKPFVKQVINKFINQSIAKIILQKVINNLKSIKEIKRRSAGPPDIF